MKLNIAVLPGDGIGPEIVNEALKVTKTVCEKFGHELSYKLALSTKQGILILTKLTNYVCNRMLYYSGLSEIRNMITIRLPKSDQNRDYSE